MIIEDPEDNHPFGEAVYLSPVFSNNKYIGPVVSSGFGHRVNKSIAMAIIDRSLINKNDEIHVEVLGRKRKAKIVEKPLYDPENIQLKS